jgi:hypothetical protein
MVQTVIGKSDYHRAFPGIDQDKKSFPETAEKA